MSLCMEYWNSLSLLTFTFYLKKLLFTMFILSICFRKRCSELLAKRLLRVVWPVIMEPFLPSKIYNYTTWSLRLCAVCACDSTFMLQFSYVVIYWPPVKFVSGSCCASYIIASFSVIIVINTYYYQVLTAFFFISCNLLHNKLKYHRKISQSINPFFRMVVISVISVFLFCSSSVGRQGQGRPSPCLVSH